MALAPDVVELVNIVALLDAAEAEATRTLDALRQAEASGIGELAVLECRQQFANGRAEGLAAALEVLTGRPAVFHRLQAVSSNNIDSRTPSAVAASPEKREPAAFVDAGSRSGRRDNGVEGARPAGDGGARAGTFPRCLP